MKGLKQAEWNKMVANKKSVMTLICGQCDETTLTELALGPIYKVNHNNGNLANFYYQLRFICYKN